MWLKRWEDLPPAFQTESVRSYYIALQNKKFSLAVKRMFDILASAVLILLLSPVLAVVAVAVRLDSKGPALFRQTRITRYGRPFFILKFRTMVANAQELGAQVTCYQDTRITRAGRFLRRSHLDELPQLFNILKGDMSFVGTRPEVPRYVEHYTDEMLATLLMPAGVTSEASIRYQDEARLLQQSTNVDETYIKEVLPPKMAYNLQGLKLFGLGRDLRLMLATLQLALGRGKLPEPADQQQNEITV